MKSKASQELDKTAASIAEQISRFRDRSDSFLALATNRIRRAFDFYENLLTALASKSEPKTPNISYGERGREEHRTHNLRTWNGYGFGCDVCGGGFDVPTFMTLRIGWYKATILIDFCLPCTKRLSSIVDARIEDKRRA